MGRYDRDSLDVRARQGERVDGSHRGVPTVFEIEGMGRIGRKCGLKNLDCAVAGIWSPERRSLDLVKPFLLGEDQVPARFHYPYCTQGGKDIQGRSLRHLHWSK